MKKKIFPPKIVKLIISDKISKAEIESVNKKSKIRYNIRIGYNKLKKITYGILRPNIRERREYSCFDGSGNISTVFARKYYQLICDYISYFGQNPEKLIGWAEKPDDILKKVDSIK